ncbi:retrovirus-related Pol polyprotein from type-1 retrotransposable element R2 [Caerostris extrusa]|uniref:Retrovirus-related Pol polyprotein from type-1 retrotransposable element R2 n=1 Tax=Caerostris extrusa TaxID=172846 RepID=A0AAV4SA41_CAEEX|nr:retrovirus-related Pol polyprotein from type-1 retrotransposable element R2 [Caerostris extrusa]
MAEFDHARFLGKPVGFNAGPDYSNINEMCELGMEHSVFRSVPLAALMPLKPSSRPHAETWVRIPLAAEESDLNLVDAAFKLLTSKDEHVRLLARVTPQQDCATACPRCSFLTQILTEFMSGVIEGRYATSSNKLSTPGLWPGLGQRRLNIGGHFVDGVPRLAFQDLILKPQQRRRILHSIRNRLRTNRSLILRNKAQSGQAF